MAEVINVRKVMRIWKSIYVRECLFFSRGYMGNRVFDIGKCVK